MALTPTLSDVAARAGVSKGAASLALNHKPGVSVATRERIERAARDLGFQPHATARALATRRSNTFGLILTRRADLLASDPFFPPFIAGVETVLAPAGLALTLRFVEPEQECAAYLTAARSRRVDGLLVADLRVGDPRPGWLDAVGFPYVTLNRPDTPAAGPAVCLDDRFGIRRATEHLVELGHRSIAHVAGPGDYLHANGRRGEWAAVMLASGLDPTDVLLTDFTARGGARATETLLRRDVPPTAIVYANDLMAMAGLAVAHRLGVDVPGRLSVIGYDDAELAAHLHPPLSTVATNADAWGRAAAMTLLEVLAGYAPADVHLPPARYVDRSSTAPPGAATPPTDPSALPPQSTPPHPRARRKKP